MIGSFLTRQEMLISIGLGNHPKIVIEHKVLMTLTMKAKFEALQQAYEAVASCRC